MIRHGVAAMLAPESSIVCVGEAGDGLEALSTAPATNPHVVVMDIALPRLDGIEALTALRKLLPATRFVVLTGIADPDTVRRAAAAGAVAYLLKNTSEPELVQAVIAAYKGESTLASETTAALAAGEENAQPAVGHDLTQRERELLSLMARGMSNQEISLHLSIAMPTVKFHVTNILSKLHADNRTEAVLIALRNKLVVLQ
jgi:two-component system, NarL family, response regulator LiaR